MTKKQLSLNEIKIIVNDLAKKINVPKKYIPSFDEHTDFAHPNIEVDHTAYNYVITEKGNELLRKVTHDLEELLYWVFSDITFIMACDYELKNRVLEQDSRRMIFKFQEKLLGTLNQDWKLKKEKEHKIILAEHPFDDNAEARINLFQFYVDNGMESNKAWEKSCKKYPLT